MEVCTSCYEPEPIFVSDIDATETSFLPGPSSDFLIIVIVWCLIGWALRLMFLLLSLREFMLAKANGRVSEHHDVPLHSQIMPLDHAVRLRFLGYLRARTPEAPTAQVVAYTNPVELRSLTLDLSTPDPSLAVYLDCTLPATLQIFWGVAPQAGQRVERLPSSRPSTHTPRGGDGGVHGTATAGMGSSSSSPSTVAALRPSRFSRLRSRSRGTQPVMHELGGPPGAMEMTSLGSASDRSKPALADARERDGASARDSTNSTGGAPRPPMAPTHTLPRALFQHASAAVELPSGLGQRVCLPTEALPTLTSLVASLRDAEPILILISAFGTAAAVSAHVAPPSTPPTPAAAGASASASASASAGEEDPEPTLGDETLPPALMPEATAATSPSLSLAAVHPCVEPSVSSVSLAGVSRVPAQCVAATVTFTLPAGFTAPAGRPGSPRAPAATGTNSSSASSMTLSTTSASAASASTEVATSSVLLHPLSPRSPQRDADAAERGEAGSSLAGSAPDATGGGGARIAGSVGKVVLGTPEGFLEVADVFGLEQEGEGEEQALCVACLSEPKDTIVLPCRHLCVCSSCFDQLANDRCPVCRTPFTSFMRIDPTLAPNVDS